MLPLLLIMALIASATDPGFIQPNVVYAAEESTALPQGTQAASSIVLGKGTIEITIQPGDFDKVDSNYLKQKGIDAHELKKDILL